MLPFLLWLRLTHLVSYYLLRLLREELLYRGWILQHGGDVDGLLLILSGGRFTHRHDRRLARPLDWGLVDLS